MIVLTDFEFAVGIELTGQHCVSFPGQVTHLTGHRPRKSQRAAWIVSFLCVLSSWGERSSRFYDLTLIHSLEGDTVVVCVRFIHYIKKQIHVSWYRFFCSCCFLKCSCCLWCSAQRCSTCDSGYVGWLVLLCGRKQTVESQLNNFFCGKVKKRRKSLLQVILIILW